MTPEVEHLLTRCGMPSQIEEYVNDILSLSPSQLTDRLMKAVKEVQAKCLFFGQLKRDSWYIVAPATPDDYPRCHLGEVFINMTITFPDLKQPYARCSKKEREEFEKMYARTFLEKLQLIQGYAMTLARTHELSETEEDLLLHARDFLMLSIYHTQRDHDINGSADAREELSLRIEKMKSCLSAIHAEQKRRFKEKGSP